MENIFNKNQVALNSYLIVKDGRSSVVKDSRFFTTVNIPIIRDEYTLCGANGAGFFSYSIRDKFKAEIEADMNLDSVVTIDTSSSDARYLVLCGSIDDLDNLMILDGDVRDSVSDLSNIPYIQEMSSGSKDKSYQYSAEALVATSFDYDASLGSYRISGLSRSVSSVSELSSSFMLYVANVGSLDGSKPVYLIDKSFTLTDISGNLVDGTLDIVNDVLQLLVDRVSGKARILLSRGKMMDNLPDMDGLSYEILED